MNKNQSQNAQISNNSPNTALFGTQFGGDEYRRNKQQQQSSMANIQTIQNSPVGRYAAPRPACSMAEVFCNGPQNQKILNVSQNANQSQQQMYQNTNGTTVNVTPVQVNQNASGQLQATPVNNQVMNHQQMNSQMGTQEILPQPMYQSTVQPVTQNPNQFVGQTIMQPYATQSVVQNTPQSIVSQPVVHTNAQSINNQMALQQYSQATPNQIIYQAMPQETPQSVMQTVPQIMTQPMIQAVPQPVNQIISQPIVQGVSQQTVPQNFIQNPQIQTQVIQNAQQQSMTNHSQQPNNQTNSRTQNGVNNKNEKTNPDSPVVQRRYRANGLSDNPQIIPFVPTNPLDFVHPAGIPSTLHRVSQKQMTPIISTPKPMDNLSQNRIPNQTQNPNTSFLKSSAITDQQQQQAFQQNQIPVLIPQVDSNAGMNLDLNQKQSNESVTSMKSRRFKADGLTESPQRVLQTAKIDSSKLLPAGKPSGMRYDKNSVQNTQIQNSNGNAVMTHQSNSQTIMGQSPNQYTPVESNQVQVQNTSTISPQAVNAPMTVCQPLVPVAHGVPITNGQVILQPIPQNINVQRMGVQMVGNQELNPQVLENQMPVVQDFNKVQSLNNVPITASQNASGQVLSSRMSNPHLQNAQLNNQVTNPNPQIINNQMVNPHLVNPQSQTANSPVQVSNPPQIANNQMGDFQIAPSPQMQSYQIINTLNPSEPLQIQLNETEKMTYNTSVQDNRSGNIVPVNAPTNVQHQ